MIDEQVVAQLSTMQIPVGYKERVEQAVQSRVENQAALEHMHELEEMVKRIDFSWKHGFLNQADYVEKWTQLYKEMEAVRPIDYDNLTEAADLLENFNTYWAACEQVTKPDEARQQLIAKIVDRIFVYDDKVIAIALHGDYSILLDEEHSIPNEVRGEVSKAIKTTKPDDVSGCTQCGSDGVGYRTCYCWTAFNIDYRLVVGYWLQHTLTVQSHTCKSHSPIALNHNPASIDLPNANAA